MRTLFDRWWVPLTVFALVVGGIYAYERWGPQSINSAVEFPFGRAIAIFLVCLYLLASAVYQATKHRWLPALLSATVLVWAVDNFFL